MLETLWDKFLGILPTLLSAAAIFAGGIICTKLLLKFLKKALDKSKVEETAHAFILSLVRSVLYVIIVIMTLTKLNVPMTSIIATLSAAGLAVGLALQSSLANVAGGFIIMFSHPFKVGDFIQIEDSTGTVDSITILYTRLLTTDNKAVLIPNGTVSKSTITNYTQEEYRRLDMFFSIGYQSDFRKAISILKDIIEKNPMTLTEPQEPTIVMAEHSDSAIKILVKIWVKSEDYWNLNYYMLESVKDSFDEAGIDIPYNQLDIHISNENTDK